MSLIEVQLMMTMDVQPASQTSLRISLNGQPRTTDAATLADLLAETGFADAKVATAVNGEFVPERGRGARRLSDGDQIEVVSPRQGG